MGKVHTTRSMNGVHMVSDVVGVNQGIETGKTNSTTAFHAPEGGGTAHGGEEGKGVGDLHVCEYRRSDLR